MTTPAPLYAVIRRDRHTGATYSMLPLCSKEEAEEAAEHARELSDLYVSTTIMNHFTTEEQVRKFCYLVTDGSDMDAALRLVLG